MKPGDLVEFKPGLFGLKPPKNVGVYLDRVQRKKVFFVVLWTVKGRLEVKADNVTKRRIATRLDAPYDDATLQSRFAQLLHDVGKGELVQQAEAPGDLNEHQLWERVASDPAAPMTPDVVARTGLGAASDDQVKTVRKILEQCLSPGVGHFAKAEGDAWLPLSKETHKRLNQAIAALNGLRRKLVQRQEVEEAGVERTVHRGVPIEKAALTAQERELLETTIRDAMADFLQHDRWRGKVGLAGTNISVLDGFDLFRWCQWLSMDWLNEPRTTVSSAFCNFLVQSGLWTLEEAIVAVARRKVNLLGAFTWTVPEDAEREARQFPDSVPEAWLQGRRDLRGLRSFTIDPADAKDHDDAVSVEKHGDGTWTLWVHIADVAHYVRKDSMLDHYSKRRATSVYLPTGVLPMLPHRLSDNLCSLNQGVDRLALTVRQTYDAKGELLEEEPMEAVIRVEGNVSYEQVLEAIDKGEEPYKSMNDLAELLAAKRVGLQLETSELKVLLRANLIDPTRRRGTRATKMIEVFMVAANEAVARFLRDKGAPLPFRCHPLPDSYPVHRFNRQARVMGHAVSIDLPERPGLAPKPDQQEEGGSILEALKKGKIELGRGGVFLEREQAPADDAAEGQAQTGPPAVGLAQLKPEEREKWLGPFRAALRAVEKVHDPMQRELVHMKMLAALGRAYYTPHNVGHFGLGSECYGHFTSPIRRYPDLLVHRQLKAVLRGDEAPHTTKALEELSVHCSERAYNAEQLERDVTASALVFHSRKPEFQGAQAAIVSGISPGGIFVTLRNGLESRVPMADIPGGPFSVDDSESMLFVSMKDRPQLAGAIAQAVKDAKDWREVYNEELDDFVKVKFRLGDAIWVVLAERNYVEGKIGAKMAI